MSRSVQGSDRREILAAASTRAWWSGVLSTSTFTTPKWQRQPIADWHHGLEACHLELHLGAQRHANDVLTVTVAERLIFRRIGLKRDLFVDRGAVVPNEAVQVPFTRTRREARPISVSDREGRLRRAETAVAAVAPRARNGRASVIVPHLRAPKEAVGRHGHARTMPRCDRPPPARTHRPALIPGGCEAYGVRILITKLHVGRRGKSRKMHAAYEPKEQREQPEPEDGHVSPRKAQRL
jgi:hypothetical protein